MKWAEDKLPLATVKILLLNLGYSCSGSVFKPRRLLANHHVLGLCLVVIGSFIRISLEELSFDS